MSVARAALENVTCHAPRAAANESQTASKIHGAAGLYSAAASAVASVSINVTSGPRDKAGVYS